jgi:hypothetical protein
VTTLTTASPAEALARFDGGEGGTRLVTPTGRYDPNAVYLTGDGLAVQFAPDRRFLDEPYVHAEDGWPRYTDRELGTLRAIDLGGDGAGD